MPMYVHVARPTDIHVAWMMYSWYVYISYCVAVPTYYCCVHHVMVVGEIK